MSEISIEAHGAVEKWTLEGEARRNAISRAMAREMGLAVERVTAFRQVRAVVLTGAGQKAFCAGADLKERATMSETEVREFLTSLRGLLRGLEKSDCVFIAYLNGLALGGGTELALACDLRMAAPHAELGLTEVKLGIIPGGGGTQRLPRLIGRGAAKDLILTGRRVNADEALRLGLVERVGSIDEAMEWAKTIASNAPIAVGAAKHAIDEGMAVDLDAALELEHQKYELTLKTEDRLEGLSAFVEKRPPVFQGK